MSTRARLEDRTITKAEMYEIIDDWTSEGWLTPQELLDDIVTALSQDELRDCLSYIARMRDVD